MPYESRWKKAIPHIHGTPVSDTEPDDKPNWQWVAAVMLQGTFLRKERKDKDSPILPFVCVRHDSEEVLLKLHSILRIGQKPRAYLSHTRKGGEAVKRWEWQVMGQLEVYWLLTNIARYTRGEQRRQIEDAVKVLDDHLRSLNRIRSFSLNETGRKTEDFEKARDALAGGFMERTRL